MEVMEALERALAHERALRAERDEIDKQLADLEVEVRGLRMAVERYSQGTPDLELAPIEVTPDDFVRAARTDAVALVLASASDPMSPTEITQRLQDLGRTDDYTAVSATLAYLHRTGRVHSVGRGQWLPGGNPDPGHDGDGQGTASAEEAGPS